MKRPINLLPTPIRLRIAAAGGQLFLIRTIGEHGPDLLTTGAAGLKHDVPAVRRPRGEIIAATIVGQLHPLSAGNVHDVYILRSGCAGTIVPNPGKH